ncbi:hypothetical protein CY34DRAFT_369148 [Suillus luteus UH-Slu-Lm8-n1]|uniref:Uncharacterized protein n=1 Tax=Suillus luteus UH-Slu-Lm8-n1 TaxID=930992 RepID=A0A0D0BUR4_9AGAM|nr:hypothetical protein CY34DRAFT_369148 [Suillus luteus UH-Slu-Lm8-n1]
MLIHTHWGHTIAAWAANRGSQDVKLRLHLLMTNWCACRSCLRDSWLQICTQFRDIPHAIITPYHSFRLMPHLTLPRCLS